MEKQTECGYNSTKVAFLEWKVRSKIDPWSSRKANLDMKAYSGVNREAVKVTSNRPGSSFVEAVRGLPKTNNPKVFNVSLHKFADVKDKGSDMVEVVLWDEEENDSRWLSFCVVGVFEKVAGVSSMTERLREKNILGIPLNVWCGEFFLKLGWAAGEPLLIEKETLNREILFRRKVFTLIPNGVSCPGDTAVPLPVTKKSASRKVVQFELGLASGKDMGLGSGNTKNGFLVKPKLACGHPKRAQLKEIGIIINNEDINKSAAHLGQPNMELEKGQSVERSWLSEDIGESSFEESGDGGIMVKNSVGQRSTDSESEKEISSEDRNSICQGLDELRKGISGSIPDKDRWNFDVELSKVVEKGMELGYLKFINLSTMVEWLMKEEVIVRLKLGVLVKRGLGRLEKRTVVRNLVRNIKPSILFIQESKLKHFDSRIAKSLGGFLLTNGVGVEAKGSTGGVITLWDGDVFVVNSCIFNDRCIIVSGVESVRSMRNFKMFVEAANVIDLPLHGMAFTWSNNKEDESWARLDRFLCDHLFISWFPQLVQKGLGRSLSDHNPIFLGESEVDWGPKPFWFLNGWLEDKVLLEGVRNCWLSCQAGASAGLLLKNKIRAVRSHLKAYSKTNKLDGDMIKALEEELARIEGYDVASGWTVGLREQRPSCLVKLWKQIRLDEQKWRQISRVKWLKDGDRNSKSFHIISNERMKLEVEFLEDEVWKALSESDGNKAPGSDGLNLNVIKANWELIKVHISHLQFADDMILFLEPKLEYLMNTKRILRCFELVSGLKINFHKSSLVRVSKKGAQEDDWAGKFRCLSSSFPIKYLGLPLGGNTSKEAFWNLAVNNVEQRLASWKRGFISEGGTFGSC
ncbi:hypothetical protein Dsin_013562 [Dipteronia sinensis]|uniref:Reverse transcriptase domain-containing protein n=1 Tax=Dipteronia sinensis TaxID=43782 RepID=A0AAE0E9J7_9ROSI|nr:hypothetical protein Dsin_013562 [Dipteronia sinensis]